MNRGHDRKRVLEFFLLAVAAVFFFLRFLHLRADFPNGSRWMDWSKYTDEGWYSDAAVRYFLIGHWRVPGDFNPGAALPVWPLMESVLFRFTGVGIVPARILALCMFGVSLRLTYLLVRRFASSLGAAVAVFLLATSSFSYAFSRLAILEPPLTMLFLLALFIASIANRYRWWTWIALGLLAPAMVLTKTTGACLLPAVAVLFCWRIWPAYDAGGDAVRQQSSWPILMLACGVAAITAASIWSAYFFLLIKPHYYADYHYLFTDANPAPKFSIVNFFAMTREALHAGLWIDRILYPVALAVLLLSIAWMRSLWRNPLYVANWVAIAGFMGFVVLQSNMQPRYFHMMLLPTVLVVTLGLDAAWKRRPPAFSSKSGYVLYRPAALLMSVVIAIAAAVNITETLRFVTHPRYSLINAAHGVARIIKADPAHSHLLLSISGSDITLITGLPSICDDFGTQDLEVKAMHYQPGWYAAWNELGEGTMSDITPHFRLREVARFKVFDDPDRDILILYRMTPRTQRVSRRAPAESD